MRLKIRRVFLGWGLFVWREFTAFLRFIFTGMFWAPHPLLSRAFLLSISFPKPL